MVLNMYMFARNMYLFIYSAVQEIGQFRADRLFSHQALMKWPLVQKCSSLAIFQKQNFTKV